jgi:hypothetical protein
MQWHQQQPVTDALVGLSLIGLSFVGLNPTKTEVERRLVK